MPGAGSAAEAPSPLPTRPAWTGRGRRSSRSYPALRKDPSQFQTQGVAEERHGPLQISDREVALKQIAQRNHRFSLWVSGPQIGHVLLLGCKSHLAQKLFETRILP